MLSIVHVAMSRLLRWRPAGLDVLAVPAFRAVLGGQFASDFGGTMRLAAQSWLVLDLTGSPFWVGLAAGVRAAPALVFGLLGGVAADRLQRTRVVLVAWLFMAAVAAVTGVLAATELIEAWHLVLMSAATGTAIAFTHPAIWALVPALVPAGRLSNALAMSSLSWSSAEMVGPALAGLLIARTNASASFWAITGFYVVAVLVWSRVREPAREPAERASVLSDVKAGLSHVRRTRPLPIFTFLAFEQNLLAVAVMPLIPVYARDVLQIGAGGYGLLAGAMGAGFLAGAAAVAVFGNFPRKGLTMVIAGAVWDACSVGFGFSRIVPLSALLLFGMGFAGPYWVNAAVTVFQAKAGDQMRGRVMSVWGITSEMFPLGWLVGGTLAQVFGYEEALIISAACGTPVAVAFYLASRSFRQV